MSTRRSAGVIFWGLLLVTMGVLMLAHNLGYPIPIWPYVVRYWPALLIAWGLLKFVDYFRFRRSGDNRPLFSGGEVALLIFVIFAGSAITTAANVNPNLGNIFEIGDFDLWDITGNNYSFDEHKEAPLADTPGDYGIEIVNYFGNVEVRPSESDRVILDAKKTVRASNQEEANRLEKDFTFSITNDGSKYRIVSNKDSGTGGRGLGRQAFKSSLSIQLPKRFAVHLDNRNGRVAIEGLTGSEDITNRFGDVEIRNITGQLTIENRNGNVTVEDVSDSVSINNSNSSTTAKNVGGNLKVDSRNGSVDVSGVKGNAAITNSYAPINVENVQGELTINGRNNSIDVQHVEGDVTANSSYQNVNIRDPRSSVNVSSRNGELTVSFEKAPQKDVVISSRYGTVTLDLPSSSSFIIDARTEFGQIDSEFDGLNHDTSNRQRAVTGQVGRGGPKITIDSKNGDIHLGKRG
jgi:type VI protein secretion system component Hcp